VCSKAFRWRLHRRIGIFGPKVEAGRALDPARVALFNAYNFGLK
jgi:hypothetical protein